MNLEKVLIVILITVAAAGLVWSAASFVSNSNRTIVENTKENFEEFVAAELPDKCQVPAGYTKEQWYEHMSHHPDRYQECF